jgi:hypothetical protein
MRFKTWWTAVAAACWMAGLDRGSPTPAAQQPPSAESTAPARVDPQKLGPQVGIAVPDFNLPDQRNQRRTLRSILGPKGAVLVFFRSADW